VSSAIYRSFHFSACILIVDEAVVAAERASAVHSISNPASPVIFLATGSEVFIAALLGLSRVMIMVPGVVPHDVSNEVVDCESGVWNSKHDNVGGNNLGSRSKDLAVHEQLDQLRHSHDGPDACDGDASDQRNVLNPLVQVVPGW